MRRTVVVLSIVMMLMSAGRSLAHEGHEHKTMGTVAAVDAGHLEVTTPEGEKVSLVVSKTTRFVKGKEPATPSDVKPGMRVAVTYEEQAGRKMAHEVRMAAAAAPSR